MHVRTYLVRRLGHGCFKKLVLCRRKLGRRRSSAKRVTYKLPNQDK